MTPTALYALILAIVTASTNTLEGATLLEGLTFADCDEKLRTRITAITEASPGVRVYGACVPMPKERGGR